VLVGGMAMTLHGSSYVTTDIDFAIAQDPANASKLSEALATLNAKPKRWLGSGSWKFDPMLLSSPFLELETNAGPIHLLNRLPGLESFAALKSNSLTFPVEGVSVPVASREDLIKMKSASTRPKDRIHLLELEALRSIAKKDA
jgi:hypothetical protein